LAFGVFLNFDYFDTWPFSNEIVRVPLISAMLIKLSLGQKKCADKSQQKVAEAIVQFSEAASNQSLLVIASVVKE
jgi:hypothetical protein